MALHETISHSEYDDLFDKSGATKPHCPLDPYCISGRVLVP